MIKAPLSLMLGLLLLWLIACTGQPTPSPMLTPVSTPTPTQAPVPDAQEDDLIRHATDAYEAFNQNRWKELYGYLTPSVQQQCSAGQFGAWMERVPKDPPLALFEPKLFAYEQGYAGVTEDAGLTMKLEASRITVQGNEGLVYKKTTLSRLGQTISIVEAEEPDRWKLIDGEWRWELAEPESSEFTIGTVCEMVANVPKPIPTTTPGQPGYAWANPADLGTPLTLDDELWTGLFTLQFTLLEVLRGDEVRQLLKDPQGSIVPPIAGFEYLLARLRVEHVKGPDSAYGLDDGDFWAASSDGRYYAQVWMVTGRETGRVMAESPDLLAEPPDLAINSVDSNLGPGQAVEGWLGFLVAVDDPAPLLTYRPWSLEGHNAVTPLPWWKLYGEAPVVPRSG